MKTQPSLAFSPAPFGRGARYCELLLVKQSDSGFEAEVWGTQGLNYCPQEALDALHRIEQDNIRLRKALDQISKPLDANVVDLAIHARKALDYVDA